MKLSVLICALLPLFATIAVTQPVDGTVPPSTDLNIKHNDVNPSKIDNLDPVSTLEDTPSNPTSDLDLESLEDALSSLSPDTTPEDLSKILRGPLNCNTNRNSPWLTDTHAAANALIRDTSSTKVCWQTHSSGCTLLKSSGNAGIYTCNPGASKGVKCHTAAWAAKHIANNCKNAYAQGSGWYDFVAAGVDVWVY